MRARPNHGGSQAGTLSGRAETFARRALEIVDRLLTFAAVCLVLAIFILHLKASFDSGLFTGVSLVEEAAYTFTSAQNYLDFGFLKTGFLQDFASSADPLDHPYIYNHMPPGPDIVVALLLQVSHGDYAFMRTVLGLGALAGLGVYFLFAKALLARHGFKLAGLAILMLGAWNIANFMERQVYQLYPLLAFLPLLAFDRYLGTGRTAYFATACGIALLSTFYIEYSALSGVIFCWVFLFLTQLLPIRPRQIVAVGCAFAAGIGMHLLQNLLYLGPEIFWHELQLTLSNRIAGVPSQEEMSAFYRSIGVVHHGSHGISWKSVGVQLLENVKVAGWPALVGLLACVFALRFIGFGGPSAGEGSGTEASWRDVEPMARLYLRFGIWILGTVWAPIFLFPAFAQEVNMRGFGANLMFLGIGVAAVVSSGFELFCRAVFRLSDGLRLAAGRGFFRSLPSMVLTGGTLDRVALARAIALAGLIVFGWRLEGAVVPPLLGQTRQVARVALAPRQTWRELETIRDWGGELFMTNINVPLVGFLTRSPGFGVCGPRSMDAGGAVSLAACKVGFMRRVDYWRAQRPRYFFYFSDRRLFPAFADCLPANTIAEQNRLDESCMAELLTKLSLNYDRVLDGNLVKVFDLAAIRPGR